MSAEPAAAQTVEDFRRFTHMVALDRDNLAHLRAIAPRDATASLSLLLDHAGRPGEGVRDPYYGGEDGFEQSWADAVAGARGLARLLGDG